MDLRIEKTYRALIKAFTDMLEEMHYESITIAALCDRALIRRTTFYKHFADKDEFFTFFMLSLRDEFQIRIAKALEEGGESALPIESYEARMMQELADFLIEHERLVDNIISSSSSHALFDALTSVIANDIVRHIEKNRLTHGNTPASSQATAVFLSGGIMGSMRHWWTSGRSDEGRLEMIRLIEAMSSIA